MSRDSSVGLFTRTKQHFSKRFTFFLENLSAPPPGRERRKYFPPRTLNANGQNSTAKGFPFFSHSSQQKICLPALSTSRKFSGSRWLSSARGKSLQTNRNKTKKPSHPIFSHSCNSFFSHGVYILFFHTSNTLASEMSKWQHDLCQKHRAIRVLIFSIFYSSLALVWVSFVFIATKRARVKQK